MSSRPAMRRALPTWALLLALTAGSAPAPASGQPPPPDITLVPARTLLPPPYTDPERSVRLLETLRRLNPEEVELHLAAAREATALGILGAEPETRVAWLEEAVAAARAAVALDSLDAEANYWLAASLGLLADQEGGRTKISLAREAHLRTLRTLELDPDHGGAHHILGRLHAGGKRLSWVSRLIARGLGLGAILDEASWESAEEHLRLGVEHDPGPLVHHYELARLLVETGSDPAAGRALLRDLAERPPRHDLDAYYTALARRSLEELGSGALEAGTGG